MGMLIAGGNTARAPILELPHRTSSDTMSVLRPFSASDLFKFNNMYVMRHSSIVFHFAKPWVMKQLGYLDRNSQSHVRKHAFLDSDAHSLSKYGIAFYLSYLSRWPDLCCVEEAPNGRLMGYGELLHS